MADMNQIEQQVAAEMGYSSPEEAQTWKAEEFRRKVALQQNPDQKNLEAWRSLPGDIAAVPGKLADTVTAGLPHWDSTNKKLSRNDPNLTPIQSTNMEPTIKGPLQGPPVAPANAPGAIPDAPTTPSSAPQKEPSVPEVSPGSSPPPSPEVGGVSNTVAESQAEVNKLLGRKPSAGKLRAAVDAYEKYNADLKAQGADTSDIDASLAQAKSAYEEKANRNEMLGLVQMVAQGFAKLAAYNYGSKNGRYIADQVNPPTVDYEKRTDRAMDERKLDESGLEKKRTLLERQTERDYQAQKDKGATLKERIGAEESALGRETSMYGSELSAARNEASGAKRDDAAAARDKARQDSEDRKYAATDYGFAQKDESKLVDLDRQLGAKDKKGKPLMDSSAAVSTVAERLGMDDTQATALQEQVDTARKSAEDADKWNDGVSEEEAGENAARKTLHSVLAAKIAELKARKEQSRSTYSGGGAAPTGASPAVAPAASPAASSAGAGAPQFIVHKSGAKRPYDAALWKQVSTGPEAADFSVQ